MATNGTIKLQIVNIRLEKTAAVPQEKPSRNGRPSAITMIDILRDGIVLDPGAVYSLQLQRAGFLVRDCVYYEYEYASYYRQSQNKFEKVLERFLESFGN